MILSPNFSGRQLPIRAHCGSYGPLPPSAQILLKVFEHSHALHMVFKYSTKLYQGFYN